MGAIQHVGLELAAAVVQDELRFWALLGFAHVPEPPTLTGRAVWAQRGEQQVHLLIEGEPVVPRSAHVAVIEPHLAEVAARLVAAGHPVESGTPHWGADRVTTRSPAGHRVELMAAAPPRLGG